MEVEHLTGMQTLMCYYLLGPPKRTSHSPLRRQEHLTGTQVCM
jgi:hypothetical protein